MVSNWGNQPVLNEEIPHQRLTMEKETAKTHSRGIRNAVTPSDREHAYVACVPGSRILQVLREVAEEVLKLLLRSNDKMLLQKVDLEISLSPEIRTSFERKVARLEIFDNVTTAVRVIRDLDRLLLNADSTVVVLDELESLNAADRIWALAHSDVVDVRIDEWLRLYSESPRAITGYRPKKPAFGRPQVISRASLTGI